MSSYAQLIQAKKLNDELSLSLDVTGVNLLKKSPVIFLNLKTRKQPD